MKKRAVFLILVGCLLLAECRNNPREDSSTETVRTLYLPAELPAAYVNPPEVEF